MPPPAKTLLLLGMLTAGLLHAGTADDNRDDGVAVPAPPAPDWQRFAGTWVPRPGAAEVVRAAEEHATEPMNFITRAFARKRLHDRFPPPGPITFSVEADLLVLRFHGDPPQRIPLDGSPRVRDGIAFSIEFEDGRLRHTGVAQNGTRENVFEHDPARDVLTMRTTITSPRLPRPVQYELEFARAAAR